MNSKTDIIPNVAREKIKELEDENDIKLSNLQKVLCSVEGPIARVLDILYGDMNIFVLDQHIEKANEDIAEKVEINTGDEVDIREVILHKHGRPLVYGLSYIPKDRCSNTVIEELLNENITTGRILLEHEIETITKIEKIYLEKPDAKLQDLFHNEGDLLTREFILIHKKNIVIWSKEAYPLSYFMM
ncbi:chorismate lyase [Methanobrevibacter sp.]|uniref:chorismate lyase n=1 Tax=Methanobrevibacter sp. TaxID=66852 RepID=UPI00386A687E